MDRPKLAPVILSEGVWARLWPLEANPSISIGHARSRGKVRS